MPYIKTFFSYFPACLFLSDEAEYPFSIQYRQIQQHRSVQPENAPQNRLKAKNSINSKLNFCNKVIYIAMWFMTRMTEDLHQHLAMLLHFITYYRSFYFPSLSANSKSNLLRIFVYIGRAKADRGGVFLRCSVISERRNVTLTSRTVNRSSTSFYPAARHGERTAHHAIHPGAGL